MKHLSTLYQRYFTRRSFKSYRRRSGSSYKEGYTILVLDDSALINTTQSLHYAMPMLLAVSHIHQLLIKEDLRMSTSIVALSGETREVHHVACLLGYGANAVIPT